MTSFDDSFSLFLSNIFNSLILANRDIFFRVFFVFQIFSFIINIRKLYALMMQPVFRNTKVFNHSVTKNS